MDIFPLGHASFRLRGKQATVVTDPYDSDAVGFKFPKNIESDVVTISHNHRDHNDISAVAGNPFVASGPGEYEIKGVSIIGVSSFHDTENGKARGRNVMYRIDMDGVHIVHLGDLGHPLTSQETDELDGVDVLFIPVGGYYTIDAKTAVQVVSDIEPKIVIPMHYQTTGHAKELADKLAPVSVFLKELGKETVAPVSKLTVSKDKIPAEMQVVILE